MTHTAENLVLPDEIRYLRFYYYKKRHLFLS